MADDPTKASLRTLNSLSSKQVELPLWNIILIEVIAFLLQAILLLILYILLCRQIANHYDQMMKTASAQAQAPKKPEGNYDPPASERTGSKRNVASPALAYRDDNDSDSDSDSSSDSSDSSESYPPVSTSKAPKDMNYSTLVFPATVSQKTLSPEDYKNSKAAGDYVNVDPKKHRSNAWNFDCSFSSEPVEYTEVAV